MMGQRGRLAPTQEEERRPFDYGGSRLLGSRVRGLEGVKCEGVKEQSVAEGVGDRSATKGVCVCVCTCVRMC